MAEQAFLATCKAFDGELARLKRARGRASLRVSERQGLGLATVMSRGGLQALAARIVDQFGVDLPPGSTRSATAGTAFIGIGPGTWLACQERTGATWASDLATRLSGLASVSDQSSGYAVLRVAGPAARDLLSRGAFIDFHPTAFRPGSAAITTIAHIGVILWQLDSEPIYEIALFRSFAGSFWHWLEATCAAMGITPALDELVSSNAQSTTVIQFQQINHVS